ncbi:MAG TPA: PH domain-containing protein [Steroidobacter sp.]
MSVIEFRAPWTKELRVSSVILTLLLLAATVAISLLRPSIPAPLHVLLAAWPVIMIVLGLVFMVRGYVLTEDAILVRRLGWSTRLPLESLQSVSGDGHAMRGSIGLFNNTGLFSITGVYFNRKLRRYRALATDPSRAVVLRYPKRTIVITPHDPQQFIVRARTLLKYSEFSSAQGARAR